MIDLKQAIRQWHDYCNENMKLLVNYYPAFERETWHTSVREAQHWQATGEAGPFLTAACEVSGLTPQELSIAIVGNAEAFAARAGALVGERIAGTARLNQAKSEDVADILADLRGETDG